MPLTCLVRTYLVNEDILLGPAICLKGKTGSEGSGQVGLRSELGLSLGPVWGALLTIRLSAYHRQHCPCIASVVQLTYQH